MAVKKVNSIVIRMYRIGTGDCISLKFFSGNKNTFNMLIDCGSCRGDSNRFKSFVNEIGEYFNNQIDLLVITHEHLDHIIGFSRALNEFKKMKIKNVWLAWTEDPTNKLAKRLKKEYGIKLKALALSVQQMNERLSSNDYRASFSIEHEKSKILDGKKTFLLGLTELLGLHYEKDEINLAVSEGTGEMAKAMDFITKKQTGKQITFCCPGKTVNRLRGTEGLNFYILGPPENEELLKKEEVMEEVYERKMRFDEDFDFINSIAAVKSITEDYSIFSKEYFLKGSDRQEFENEYLKSPDNKWRNIDIEWLGASGNLALRLQRFINNTSLAFAIEFEKSGKVLLFPGDAQSGNWISWHSPNIKWNIKRGDLTEKITAKDLLNRTAFYKVGHHLSHNGTASKSGLELMNSDELVAFASLDYNNILSGWKNTMPAPGLLETLIKKTKGRVFRIDEGLIDTDEAKSEREKMNPQEANEFEKSFFISDKFIEFRIRG